VALRQIAAAAPSMITANEGDERGAADRVAERRADDNAWQRGAGERRGVTPADAPSSGVAQPAGQRPGRHDDERRGRRLVHPQPKYVDEDGNGQHGPAAPEGAEAQPDGQPERDRG
jgi:hypothetical protein